VAYE
jgi:hypothetical protein